MIKKTIFNQSLALHASYSQVVTRKITMVLYRGICLIIVVLVLGKFYFFVENVLVEAWYFKMDSV